MKKHTFLGIPVSPLMRRRMDNFKANKRGWYALWIFAILFALSLGAEMLANDKPLIVRHDGEFYFPSYRTYLETEFGGDFATEADYRDPFVRDLITENGGWMMWPPIPFDYATVDHDLPGSAPTAPSERHWLGTDNHGRDVVAQMVYGFRISVVFGFTLTLLSSAIGIAAGAIQGYFGGKVDLFGQRFVEAWSSMPELYILIIVISLFTPSFWLLLGVLLLFMWLQMVQPVRAEFLRGRNFDYVEAARALGMRDIAIVFKHVFPNAMVATVTYMPFILVASITALTSLDYLGFGLPEDYPSLGRLVLQGKNNVYAPWLGLSGFFTLAVMLTLLLFIGEAARDAFDPRA